MSYFRLARDDQAAAGMPTFLPHCTSQGAVGNSGLPWYQIPLGAEPTDMRGVAIDARPIVRLPVLGFVVPQTALEYANAGWQIRYDICDCGCLDGLIETEHGLIPVPKDSILASITNGLGTNPTQVIHSKTSLSGNIDPKQATAIDPSTPAWVPIGVKPATLLNPAALTWLPVDTTPLAPEPVRCLEQSSPHNGNTGHKTSEETKNICNMSESHLDSITMPTVTDSPEVTAVNVAVDNDGGLEHEPVAKQHHTISPDQEPTGDHVNSSVDIRGGITADQTLQIAIEHKENDSHTEGLAGLTDLTDSGDGLSFNDDGFEDALHEKEDMVVAMRKGRLVMISASEVESNEPTVSDSSSDKPTVTPHQEGSENEEEQQYSAECDEYWRDIQGVALMPITPEGYEESEDAVVQEALSAIEPSVVVAETAEVPSSLKHSDDEIPASPCETEKTPTSPEVPIINGVAIRLSPRLSGASSTAGDFEDQNPPASAMTSPQMAEPTHLDSAAPTCEPKVTNPPTTKPLQDLEECKYHPIGPTKYDCCGSEGYTDGTIEKLVANELGVPATESVLNNTDQLDCALPVKQDSRDEHVEDSRSDHVESCDDLKVNLAASSFFRNSSDHEEHVDSEDTLSQFFDVSEYDSTDNELSQFGDVSDTDDDLESRDINVEDVLDEADDDYNDDDIVSFIQDGRIVIISEKTDLDTSVRPAKKSAEDGIDNEEEGLGEKLDYGWRDSSSVDWLSVIEEEPAAIEGAVGVDQTSELDWSWFGEDRAERTPSSPDLMHNETRLLTGDGVTCSTRPDPSREGDSSLKAKSDSVSAQEENSKAESETRDPLAPSQSQTPGLAPNSAAPAPRATKSPAMSNTLTLATPTLRQLSVGEILESSGWKMPSVDEINSQWRKSKTRTNRVYNGTRGAQFSRDRKPAPTKARA